MKGRDQGEPVAGRDAGQQRGTGGEHGGGQGTGAARGHRSDRYRGGGDRVDDADEVLGPPPGGRTTYRDALREALRVPHGPARPPLWEGADPLGDPARLLPSDADWAGVRPPTIGRVRGGR